MSDASRKMEGRLVSWDDERGFGFAAVADSDDVFVHVKALRHRNVRPKVDDRVRFAVVEGRNGKPAAADVEIEGAAPPPPRPAPRAALTVLDVSRLLAALWIIIGAALAIALGRAPVWLGALYYIMALASALLYWFDKAYAVAGRSRVRETSLHVSDAFFGIAGGLAAQHVFRHKTRKRAFRTITRLIWIGHATFLAALLGGLIRLP